MTIQEIPRFRLTCGDKQWLVGDRLKGAIEEIGAGLTILGKQEDLVRWAWRNRVRVLAVDVGGFGRAICDELQDWGALVIVEE